MDYKKPFIIALILLVLLGSFLAYSYLIKPAWDKYVYNKQIEASQQTVTYIISEIFRLVEKDQYVPITYNNKTMILIEYKPQT